MTWIKKMLRATMRFFRRMFSGMTALFGKKAPKQVKVVTIVNKLTDRGVTFVDDHQNELLVAPGETVAALDNFHPPLLLHQDEITEDTIYGFMVEGDATSCSYAVVDRVGIISALGTSPEDYNIYDKAFTYLSWAKIQSGQRIVLNVVTDEDNVVWVVGDLEDNI